MVKFNYTMNHKADEAYMAKMCHEGWAARSLVEGFWTFEPCKPDEYIYREAYLRGKSLRSASGGFILLSVVSALYAGLCTCLLTSYSRLIKKLSGK